MSDEPKDPNIISLSEYRRSLASHTEINTNAILYRVISVSLGMVDKLTEQSRAIEDMNRRMIKLSTEVVRLGGKLDG